MFMPLIVFLFMNSIVMLSAFFITYKLLGISEVIDSLICLFIVYFSQVILSQLILGLFNLLYLQNVILLNLIILLVVRLAIRNKKFSFSPS